MAHCRLLFKAKNITKLQNELRLEKDYALAVSKKERPKLSLKQRCRHCYVDIKVGFKRLLRRIFCCSKQPGLRRFCYKLRHDGSCENYSIKSLFGFCGGILLTYMFFVILVFQLNFKFPTATIMCCILGIILTIGLAFSQTVRCIVLLTLPQFFSAKGRQALLAYAFVLALSGPAKNTLNNLGILSESLACGQEQLKQAVRQIIEVIKKPFMAIKEAIKAVVKTVKEIVKKIKEILLTIKRIIMAIVKVIKAAFLFLAKIINICNKELGTPFERCMTVFEGAIVDCNAKLGPLFSWMCSITYLVQGVCYIVKPFDFVCMIIDFISNSVVGVVIRKVKQFIRHIKTMFYVRIKFSHSFQFHTNTSKTLNQISEGIIDEIEARTETLREVFDFFTEASTLFFLFIIFQVSYYRYKFLTSEKFDNLYITRDFRLLDLRRAGLGKETVLPLNKREDAVYAPVGSIKLIKVEKAKLSKASTKLLVATIKLCIHMATDYALFWVMNTIRYYGRFQSKVQAPNIPTLQISGNGLLADLLRSIVKAFQPMGVQLEIDTVPCLPMPIPPDYDRYFQIAILIILCWLFTILEPYGLRFRCRIMIYYYPTRARQRAIWLYNQLIRQRNTFLKFARRQLRRKLFGNKGITKITCREYLQATIRPRCLAAFLGPEKQDACLMCGEIFRESDEVQPYRCKTPECPGIFCEACFKDLKNICTVCQSPIDYGDLSDISEEKDSSGEETKPTVMVTKKKKKICDRLRCWKVKPGDDEKEKLISSSTSDTETKKKTTKKRFRFCDLFKKKKDAETDYESEEETDADNTSKSSLDNLSKKSSSEDSQSKTSALEDSLSSKSLSEEYTTETPRKHSAEKRKSMNDKTNIYGVSASEDSLLEGTRSAISQVSVQGTAVLNEGSTTSYNEEKSEETKTSTDDKIGSGYTSDGQHSTTSSATDYSYSYQYEDKQPAAPITDFGRKTRDIEKQYIPDYATMDNFTCDCPKKDRFENLSESSSGTEGMSSLSLSSEDNEEEDENDGESSNSNAAFISTAKGKNVKHDKSFYSRKTKLKTKAKSKHHPKLSSKDKNTKKTKHSKNTNEEKPLLTTTSSSFCKCSSSDESDEGSSEDISTTNSLSELSTNTGDHSHSRWCKMFKQKNMPCDCSKTSSNSSLVSELKDKIISEAMAPIRLASLKGKDCKCYCSHQEHCKHDRFKYMKYDVVSESSTPGSGNTSYASSPRENTYLLSKDTNNLDNKKQNKPFDKQNLQDIPEKEDGSRYDADTNNQSGNRNVIDTERTSITTASSKSSSDYEKKVRNYYSQIKGKVLPNILRPQRGSLIAQAVRRILPKGKLKGGYKSLDGNDVELKSYNYSKNQWEKLSSSETSSDKPSPNSPEADSDKNRIRGGESVPIRDSQSSSVIFGKTEDTFLLESSSCISEIPHNIFSTSRSKTSFDGNLVYPWLESGVANRPILAQSSSKYSFTIEDLTPTREFSFPMNTAEVIHSPSFETLTAYSREPPEKDENLYNNGRGQLYQPLDTRCNPAPESEADSELSTDLSEEYCSNILGLPYTRKKKKKDTNQSLQTNSDLFRNKNLSPQGNSKDRNQDIYTCDCPVYSDSFEGQGENSNHFICGCQEVDSEARASATQERGADIDQFRSRVSDLRKQATYNCIAESDSETRRREQQEREHESAYYRSRAADIEERERTSGSTSLTVETSGREIDSTTDQTKSTERTSEDSKEGIICVSECPGKVGKDKCRPNKMMHSCRHYPDWESCCSCAENLIEGSNCGNLRPGRKCRSHELRPSRQSNEDLTPDRRDERQASKNERPCSVRFRSKPKPERRPSLESLNNRPEKQHYRSINTMRYIHQPEYCKKTPLTFSPPPPPSQKLQQTFMCKWNNMFSSTSDGLMQEESSSDDGDGEQEPREKTFFDLPYQNNEDYLDLVHELEDTLINRNRMRVQKTMREFEILSSQNKSLEKPIFDDDESSFEEPILERLTKLKSRGREGSVSPRQRCRNHSGESPRHCKGRCCHECRRGDQRYSSNSVDETTTRESYPSSVNYVAKIVRSMDPNKGREARKYPKFKKSLSRSHWELDKRSGEWIKLSDCGDSVCSHKARKMHHVCNCRNYQQSQRQRCEDYTPSTQHQYKCCQCKMKHSCR